MILILLIYTFATLICDFFAFPWKRMKRSRASHAQNNNWSKYAILNWNLQNIIVIMYDIRKIINQNSKSYANQNIEPTRTMINVGQDSYSNYIIHHVSRHHLPTRNVGCSGWCAARQARLNAGIWLYQTSHVLCTCAFLIWIFDTSKNNRANFFILSHLEEFNVSYFVWRVILVEYFILKYYYDLQRAAAAASQRQ